MRETEGKPYYKIGEVCEITGTQPYVLRFWESEFPGLAPEKNRSGQRVYKKRDIEMIQRIKTLLYEKEYTIAGARKVLESETREGSSDSGGLEGRAAPSRNSQARRRAAAAAPPAGGAVGAASGARSEGDSQSPSLPFSHTPASDHALEAEVKNLRAKLALAEAELRAILSDMDKRDAP